MKSTTWHFSSNNGEVETKRRLEGSWKASITTRFPSPKSVPARRETAEFFFYNERITLKNIPLSAYDYIVNGKPALEWVMERQSVITDKNSGITNDANLWATETTGNPSYPLELLQRVITVSLETNKIVNGLPTLEID